MSGNVPPTVVVVLAGGLARRMGGGDKAMLEVGGRAILDHVVERVVPQCTQVLVNANGDPSRFARFGLPVVADGVAGHPGPLAGVLAALDWVAQDRFGTEWVASVAGDCPFVPCDLVSRLHAARAAQDAELAVAASGGRTHPVIGLWPVGLREALRRALVVEEMRKIDRWTARYRIATAEWPLEPVDPFFNANRPQDLAEAEALVLRVSGDS